MVPKEGCLPLSQLELVVEFVSNDLMAQPIIAILLVYMCAVTSIWVNVDKSLQRPVHERIQLPDDNVRYMVTSGGWLAQQVV